MGTDDLQVQALILLVTALFVLATMAGVLARPDDEPRGPRRTGIEAGKGDNTRK